MFCFILRLSDGLTVEKLTSVVNVRCCGDHHHHHHRLFGKIPGDTKRKDMVLVQVRCHQQSKQLHDEINIYIK